MNTVHNDIKNVAILGGNGFTGAELYRVLSRHPYFNVEFVSSESKAGYPVEKMYRSFIHQKKSSLKFQKISDLNRKYDIVFACLPTGVLPQHIEKVAEHATYIFNVSGDYRISDQSILQQFYPESLKYEFQAGSHYFVPEFSKMNPDAKVVNLPGCMAVATIYSLYPLLAEGLIDGRVITDAKTGSSGGGKSSSEHHAERTNNFRPHKIHGHRHQPEIQSAFKGFFDQSIDLQFSTYSLDLPRGIMVTSYSMLKENVSEIDVKKTFYSQYSSSSFIRYFNSRKGPYSYPMIKTVVGTNYAEVGAYVQGRNCVSIVSIDNLIKGAAGQAIQAANLYMGIPEDTGLQFELEGVWP